MVDVGDAPLTTREPAAPSALTVMARRWAVVQSLTLRPRFTHAAPDQAIFQGVLNQYFGSSPDPETIRLLRIS